jgi:hypothetical protein
MNQPPPPPETRSSSPRVRFDLVCDRFEAEWLAGRRPRLEDFLSQAEEADRAALLRDLLALDLDYRVRHGEQPAAGE